jgi:hypothetical protein
MGRLLVFTALLAAAGTVGASRGDYLNAKRKFQSIENRQAKPGSRIALSAQELNAYVQTELPEVAPAGIRKPHVELNGSNTATGSALIDFVKLRSAQGKSTNWLLRRMLEGEHEVKVTTRIKSGDGRATVDLERVEIGGMPISGGALDFIIQNYLIPNYPAAKIGRPFNLHERVDHIEVASGVAYVVLKR